MQKDLIELASDDSKLITIAKMAIEKFDMNRKGYLNKTEVKTFFEEVAEELDTQISATELEELFCELDENATMKITHEEIKNMIKQILVFLVGEI